MIKYYCDYCYNIFQHLKNLKEDTEKKYLLQTFYLS